MKRMRGMPIGAGIIACGAAFGAGWMAGTFSSSSHTPPESPPAPGRRSPVPLVDAGPSVPEPAAPASRTERQASGFPAGGGQSRRPEETPEGSDDRLPPPGGRGATTGYDPGRPVRTQEDVAAAVRAALEQDREDRDLRERQLREGPYGEFNYDVNRLAERIEGVTDDQKRQYAGVLEWRRQARDALEKRLDDKEISRQEFDAGHREIGDYMTERMRQVLDAAQFQQYQAAYARFNGWDRGGWRR